MKLGGITITVINTDPTGFDGVGDPIDAHPTLTVVPNCEIQQHRTSREISVTDVIVSRDRLFAPPWAPLQPTSIVVIGAYNSTPLPPGTVTYLVDGEPARWNSPNGRVRHIEVYLREQQG